MSIMGNIQCSDQTSIVTGLLPIRYEVPFTPVVIKNTPQGGGKGNQKSNKDDNDGSEEKQVSEESEEEIDDELTDNIVIEDDEMNELFDEEDLDIEDAEIDRKAVNDKIEENKKSNKKSPNIHPDNDDEELEEEESEEANEKVDKEGGATSTPLSSSSPYGHGKNLAESSATMFPIKNRNNKYA